MANDTYWRDRKQRLDQELSAHEGKLFSELREYYNTEAAKLDSEIAAYYAKYGENNVIAYRKLLENLSDEDRTLLMEKLDNFAEKYPEYANLIPIRESVYKLNRLEGLRQSIAIQQMTMGAYEIGQARSFLERMACMYANGAAEQLGYGSSFYTVDHAMIKLVVGNKWCEGRDFSQRIWGNRESLARSLQSEIVNGLIRGDSYQRISKAMQEKFQRVSRQDIERLIFTEDTYLSNEAAMQVYANDADYRKYMYVAVNDAKTCDVCASLDGQVFDIKSRTPGVNFPPMHPWCRCFFDPVYERNSNSALTSGGNGGIIKSDERFEIAPPKIKQFLLKPGAKHANEFFDVGYKPDDYELLFDDIANEYDESKATDKRKKENGVEEFSIFMELGVDTKKQFRIVWRKDTPDSKPRLITGHRED